MRFLFRLLVPALLAAAGASAQGQSKHFEIDPPMPTTVEEGEVELIEFFNFSCPACFRFQAPFNRWKLGMKPENVVLVRKPVVFERAGGLYARIYFVLESVGMQEEMFQRTFDAIHKDKRLLNSEGRILDWLEEEGLDRDQMEKVLSSFSVESKITRAVREAAFYGVDSTPQMVVAGKYRLSPREFDTYLGLLEEMTRLVESEGGHFAALEGAGSEAFGN